MRSLKISPLLALALAPLGCGGPTPGPTASYSAEQLNAITGPIIDVDGPTPPATPMPVPSEGGGGEAEPPPPQPAGLRVIHASPDRSLASVSAFLDDSAVAAVQGIAYKSVAGYLELSPGDHGVVLRRANAPAGAAPALSMRTDTLDAGERSTAIVYGLVAGAQRLAIAVGTDLLGLPEEGKTRVRFFHALVGLGAVDVCRAGTPATPVFTNVAYGAFAAVQGGAYAEVPSGTPLVLQVRAQNARPCTGPVRGTVTVTTPSASVVTAVAVGRVVGAPAVPRELLVCIDAPVSGAPSCSAVAMR